MPGSNFRSV